MQALCHETRRTSGIQSTFRPPKKGTIAAVTIDKARTCTMRHLLTRTRTFDYAHNITVFYYYAIRRAASARPPIHIMFCQLLLLTTLPSVSFFCMPVQITLFRHQGAYSPPVDCGQTQVFTCYVRCVRIIVSRRRTHFSA